MFNPKKDWRMKKVKAWILYTAKASVQDNLLVIYFASGWMEHLIGFTCVFLTWAVLFIPILVYQKDESSDVFLVNVLIEKQENLNIKKLIS
jgi:hypothetical protein